MVRIGLYVGGTAPVTEVVERIRWAERAGLDSVFLNQVLGWDALTVATLALRETTDIEVGTAVTHTFARHPIALAQQALTATALGPNRFTLGIGPSHPHIVEDAYGLSYERPARHVREYLSALTPLLRGETTDYRGETLRAAATIEVAGATPPSVVVSALGPAMLKVAGELADGSVTTWTTPGIIAEHIGPRLAAAAAAAGRPAPRTVVVVSAAVTHAPDDLRQELAQALAPASRLPSYRALLDRQHLTGVHETALLGPEDVVAEGISAYARAGVTDLIVSVRGDAAAQQRTRELISTVRRASSSAR
ncbi:TIGR03564 family F420-dependent LLM class oxidoreductase [Nocardia mikamii]|uniref:TIGR03564 family F420-dependent LLM class oxidoreductase n=1 Tax=Nocardia mikamii TaxID=508464 RepID=UPI0007A429FB|nr:TIGR03564 family F420-dependent LLM class oxidoreductase [Nocardia mikamii]